MKRPTDGIIRVKETGSKGKTIEVSSPDKKIFLLLPVVGIEPMTSWFGAHYGFGSTTLTARPPAKTYRIPMLISEPLHMCVWIYPVNTETIEDNHFRRINQISKTIASSSPKFPGGASIMSPFGRRSSLWSTFHRARGEGKRTLTWNRILVINSSDSLWRATPSQAAWTHETVLSTSEHRRFRGNHAKRNCAIWIAGPPCHVVFKDMSRWSSDFLRSRPLIKKYICIYVW